MNEAPLYWVKQIQETLIEAKAIPLSGNAPAFPWEKLAEKLGDYLQNPEVKIHSRKTQFLPAEEISLGWGAGQIAIAIELTPLPGQAFWLMGKEDVAKLATLALFSSSENRGFSSAKFQEGFYYFLATQAMAAIDELQAFKDLGPKIGKFSSLPQEQALCMDIEIQHPRATLWGRLACPASLLQAFKSHFSAQPKVEWNQALIQQTEILLHLQVGQTTLPLSKWKGIATGDFIFLDRCSFDPATKKGTVTLVLEDKPILQARIKDNSIKIVDYDFYQEEQNPMTTDMPTDEEPYEEKSFEEENLSSSDFETEEEAALWEEQNSPQGEIEKMIAPEEIPIVLTVEVARLRMTLDKLLQLSPGNVLDLSVKPEHGVDITIGGKKVAKAELVKLGDMLGIKILQIGE